jgi:hypothetical protein
VLLRPLIDQELSVVFYDPTTVGVEGATELPGDVREYGMSKDGGIARQFMLGVVQTAEGLPIAHRVWQGNTAEAVTLEPGRRQLSWPVDDNYPGRWRRGSFVVVVGSLTGSLAFLFQVAVWQAKRVRP